jgi:hypothetical protein
MTSGKIVRAALLPLLVLPFLIARCGGGGSSAPPTVDDFCKALSEAECTVGDRCEPITKEQCEANRKQKCMDFAATEATGGRVFTPANQADCINRSRNAYSNTAAITPTTLAEIERACRYVFQGTKALQVDACTLQFECAGTTNGTIICDKGFCAMASAPKAIDMPCGNAGDVCASNAYCGANSAGNRICVAKVMGGMPCSMDAPCIDTLRCMGGTCTNRVESGGACSSNADCVSSAPYCNPYAGNICLSGLSFASGSPSCQGVFGAGTPTGAGGTSGGAAGTSGGAAGTSGGAAGTGGGAAGTGGGAAGRGGTGGGNADASLD